MLYQASDNTHSLLLLLFLTRNVVTQSVPVPSLSLGTYSHGRRHGQRLTVWPEYELRIILFLSCRRARVQDWFSRTNDIRGPLRRAWIAGEREGVDVRGGDWLFLGLLVYAGGELEGGGKCGGLFLLGLGGREGVTACVWRPGGLPLLWLILRVLCGEFDAAVEGHSSGARWYASREKTCGVVIPQITAATPLLSICFAEIPSIGSTWTPRGWFGHDGGGPCGTQRTISGLSLLVAS